MSLDPVKPAEGIWVAQQQITGLEEYVDEDGDRGVRVKTDEQGLAIRPDMSADDKQQHFAKTFADEYNDYAIRGEVLGADDGSEDKSIIESFLNSVEGGEGTTPELMGEMLASYWSTVKLEPGEPQVLDVVTLVVNNAETLESSFTQAVTDSITTELGTPPYYDRFISNVEAVVKTIAWTITEQNTSTGGTTTYVSNIS